MKNQIFVSLLILLVFSPFSHSEDVASPPFKGLGSKLMDLLGKGDITGYRQLRQNALRSVSWRDSIHKGYGYHKLRKALATVDEQGNNILHFIVHLEQSEGLQYESDELVRLLTGELDSLFGFLGARRFSRLLIQKNKHGVSPMQKAEVSRGPAYEALRTVVQKRSYSLRSGFSEGLLVFPYVIAGKEILDWDVNMMMNALGVASIAYGLNICYTAFSKRRTLKKINEQLSSPLDL